MIKIKKTGEAGIATCIGDV